MPDLGISERGMGRLIGAPRALWLRLVVALRAGGPRQNSAASAGAEHARFAVTQGGKLPRAGEARRRIGPSLAAIGQRWLLPTYTVTIFFSALLLFMVQPLVAKLVLPVLGGAPATWAVSLCFFQAVLLLGYAYAHALAAVGRVGLWLHLCVLLAAMLALPIALPAVSDPPVGNAYLWLLGVLAGMVGLPFFALSASAPLLQAWFRGSAHTRSADPYFLYAASNTGSLAALLAYPLLIEPLLPLTLQRQYWAAGFLVLTLLIATCGLLLPPHPAPWRTRFARPSGAQPIPWRERLQWTFLAFVPSGLLVAVTTYLATDLASAPLLWVLPLALYLSTFIVTFRDRVGVSERVLIALQPAAIAGVLVASEWMDALSWAVAAVLALTAFVITGLLCHRQLYQRRPAAEALTGFYFCVSLGGVLGGAFAALIAPLVFNNVQEFPLLLGLGMLCRPALRHDLGTARGWTALAMLLAAGCAVALLLARLIAWTAIPNTAATRLYVLAALGAVLIAAQRWARVAWMLTAALVLGVAVLPFATAPVYTTRSFFGTHRVVDTAGGAFRLLLDGTTLHGIQRNGAPGTRPTPIGYYYAGSPMAVSVQLARAAAGGPDSPLRVGVVGLGTGALACYALPLDHWRFYEIDPTVARIAADPAYFRALSTCTPGAEIVLGDARLMLKKEPPASFDLLVLDAFSSDAIPVHLLTVEALGLYTSLLSEHGILTLHISNQNLDLPPVLEANLAQLPQLHAVYAEGERGPAALASQVVLVSRHADALLAALQLPHARRLGAGNVRPWTDDYSDIVSAMLRRIGSKLEGALAAPGAK
jgi:hypothetical protein